MKKKTVSKKPKKKKVIPKAKEDPQEIKENSQDVAEFLPTTEMLLWLKMALDIEVKPFITSIAEACAVTMLIKKGIDPDSKITPEDEHADTWRKRWYRWNENINFKKWYVDEYKKGIEESEWLIDKIGLSMAGTNPKYFEIMQMKYFKFRSKLDHTTNNESLNNANPFDNLPLKEKLTLAKKLGVQL